MRTPILPLLGLLFVFPCARAQMPAETPGVVTLATPTPAWFLLKAEQGAYVFDGDSGEMQGMIANDTGLYSPAIVTVPARQEAYLVESFYSRATGGERNDVLTVVGLGDLSTKTEIDIPDRAAALSFRNHIGIMGDDRHLAVFNQTPAQSVGIIDVVDREYVGEIATPGCAVIMPSGERAFLMICGDGRLQLIELDESGKEARRTQSAVFFSVEEDAVFDQPVKTADGWALVSREGLVYTVGVEGSRIRIGKPWPISPEEEKPAQADDPKWRPGGKQVFTIHRATGLLYALMHEGKIDTHAENGTEIWVVDLAHQRRVGRLELEEPASHVLASQEQTPKLYVLDAKSKLHIYDARRLHRLRTIEEPGGKPFLLQALSQYD